MNKTKKERALNQYEYIFEPDYVVNINKLIIRFENESNAPDIDLIKSREKIENNYVLRRHQSDFDKIFSAIADEASQFCRNVMHREKKFVRDYLIWCRVSVSHGGLHGSIQLVNYCIAHNFDKKMVGFWLGKTMQLVKDCLKNTLRADDVEVIVQQALEVLTYASQTHSALAAPYSLTLLKYCNNYHLSVKDDVQKHVTTLLDNSDGIRVIDAIGKSNDRIIKDTCDRYSLLEKSITRLATIENIHSMKQTLDNEFPWYSQLTKKIVAGLMVRMLGKGSFYIPPLLILGEPGIGKTTYVKRLAEVSNVPYQMLSLAGQNDNRYLQGTARGWSTGQPSMPVTLINDHKIANPIVLLDELDKSGGSDRNGRVIDSLLTLFEPSSAARVFDDYLLGHADLSHISWICTANNVSQMQNTILSRLDIVTVQGPKPEHYPAIIKKSINDFCQRNDIHSAQIPNMDEADWKWLERYYKSPRLARKATEKWLAHAMLNPINQLIN